MSNTYLEDVKEKLPEDMISKYESLLSTYNITTREELVNLDIDKLVEQNFTQPEYLSLQSIIDSTDMELITNTDVAQNTVIINDTYLEVNGKRFDLPTKNQCHRLARLKA